MSVPDPTAPALRPLDPAAPRPEIARGGADVETLAREFEAMLLLQMVRQFRQSFLEEGAGGDGLGAETMTDTFDVEFARYLSAVGGVGLARLLAAHVDASASARSSASKAGLGEPDVHGPGGPDSRTSPIATRLDRGTLAGQGGEARSEGGRPPGVDGLTLAGSVGAAGSAVGRVGVATPLASPPGVTSGQDPDPEATGEHALAMPFEADVTSAFGWRADPFHGGVRFHGGIDLRAAYGREVPVAAPGRVVFAGEQGSYGQTVVVEHAGGVRTRYAHLSSIAVRAGEDLASGAVVGRVGQSGRATGPHLHFEVWHGRERVDPLAVAAVWPALKPPAAGVDFPIDGDRVRTLSTGADHED